MPRGTYADPQSGTEEAFQCAPGVGGWRYVSERSDGLRTDLTVDSRWLQIRVQVGAGELLIRGGLAGRELLWVRSAGKYGEEHSAEAAGFLGDSPGFLVAVARSLRLEPGSHADVRLVRLSAPALSALTVTQRWRLTDVTTYDTDLAPLPVERYEVTDLATGEASAVHLAGDVVLDAQGVELVDLERPPTLPQH
ncbi:hypothetical protein [Actinomadura sp. HBU206391]|uniref:hypothetical protein n=1 Tax=Actinomadura sp. HBU206391 TaxID=2731692 RepID=UPI0016509207|nr:hypothetical protein [Actinomadura sp. HBU206391]MBC6456767.1 hypothetical protein [Actinomadura sp. HBU206391]